MDDRYLAASLARLAPDLFRVARYAMSSFSRQDTPPRQPIHRSNISD